MSVLPGRYVGSVSGAAPTEGSYEPGDFVTDRAGGIWVCTVAGTPGTWAQSSGGGGGSPTGAAGGDLQGTYPNPQLGAVVTLRGKSTGGVVNVEPIINWSNNADGAGDVGQWQTGLDVSNSVNGDLVLAGKVVGGSTFDFVYARQNTNSLSLGVGYTPPPNKATLAVTAADGSDTRAVVIRIGPGTSGDAIQVQDSSGASLWRLPANGQPLLSAMSPLANPGTIVVAPQTLGNSGQPVMKYLSGAAATGSLEFVPVGNDMNLVLKSSVNGLAVLTMATTSAALLLTPQSDSMAAIKIAPTATQTGYLIGFLNNAQSAWLGGFDKRATFFTAVNSAPADVDVAAGQMFLWFDQTTGAAKLMVKAKDAGGTVRTGSLALA